MEGDKVVTGGSPSAPIREHPAMGLPSLLYCILGAIGTAFIGLAQQKGFLVCS